MSMTMMSKKTALIRKADQKLAGELLQK